MKKLILALTILFTGNAVVVAGAQGQIRVPQFVLTIRSTDGYDTIKRRLERIVNSDKFQYQGIIRPFEVPNIHQMLAESLPILSPQDDGIDTDGVIPPVPLNDPTARALLIGSEVKAIQQAYPDRFRVVYLQ